MMRDSLAYAAARRLALLLLYGAPGYYPQFGYADVADVTEHDVDRERIAALAGAAPAGCGTRPATPADAPALLDLYRRHHDAYRGGFERTLEDQRYLLRHRLLERPPLVAVDGDGRPQGYLMFAYGPWWRDPALAHEVAADTWPATLALLRAHAALLAARPAPPRRCAGRRRPMPRSSSTWATTCPWSAAPRSARGRAGRPASSTSRRSSRPARRTGRPPSKRWGGATAVARTRCESPSARPTGARRRPPPPPGRPPPAPPVAVRLTRRLLAALLFGYRPASWAAAHPEASVPAAATPLLAALFPAGTPWVAGSDAF